MYTRKEQYTLLLGDLSSPHKLGWLLFSSLVPRPSLVNLHLQCFIASGIQNHKGAGHSKLPAVVITKLCTRRYISACDLSMPLPHCPFNVCCGKSYAHFKISPYKFHLSENTKVVCLHCTNLLRYNYRMYLCEDQSMWLSSSLLNSFWRMSRKVNPFEITTNNQMLDSGKAWNKAN